MPEPRNRKHRLRPFMVSNNPVQTRKPHEPSAAIHIEDDNAGFLMSRLDTAQRASIPDPTVGLLIWHTTAARFEYYDGAQWVPLGAVPTTIPVPQIAIDKGEDPSVRDIRLFFTQSASHLAAYNPKFIMMRYRPGRTINDLPGRARRPYKRWVHPSHQNGTTAVAGSNFNSGGHYTASGVLLPPRDTEWVPASLDPFSDTQCPVDFSQWFTAGLTLNGAGVYHMPSGAINPYGTKISSKAQIFAFAVEIDNPDPATATKKPRVRGAISESVAVRWNNNTNKLTIAMGGIPSARRFVP